MRELIKQFVHRFYDWKQLIEAGMDPCDALPASCIMLPSETTTRQSYRFSDLPIRVSFSKNGVTWSVQGQASATYNPETMRVTWLGLQGREIDYVNSIDATSSDILDIVPAH